MSVNNIKQDKALLRKKLIKKRKEIEPNIKKSGDLSIFKTIISHVKYKSAPTLLTYVSTDIEVDTIRLIEHALSEGKQVAVPKCNYDTTTISFYQIYSLNDLFPSKFSLLEPRANSERLINPEQDSICIVPGLSFDRKGHRLGYGKGYYDRFLSNYSGVSIGICYKDYICDRLAVNRYDIPVNIVITDNPADKVLVE